MSARGRLTELCDSADGQAWPGSRLVVGAGGCGRARGAEAVLARLRREVADGLAVDVVAGGCNGMCFGQVVVTAAAADGARATYSGVTPDSALALANGGSRESDGEAAASFFAGQRRLVGENLGLIDPKEISDYLRHGGYATLARVLDELEPRDVIAEVAASKLLGRGGAYFPTATKWEGARNAPGEPKWLVVNAEEGEPGVYKDRHLLEGDPHRVLEGMLIAAYAVGASRGIFYINGEAHLSQHRLARALEQARECGLVGERVLGTAFSFEVEIRHGGGGYILGEETALLESIEGRRAMPRVRPPFPVEKGLWGKPTVINNAETLATVRTVLELGGEAFAQIGLPSATGTKLIGLSGNVARPGLVEVPFGTTMRQIVEEMGGGVPGGRSLKAVLIGGPSGVFVPASALDEPVQPRGVVPPGTGGWVVLDDRQSIPAAVHQLTRFNMLESCGKCTPCREGTVRLIELLNGAGDPAAILGLCEVVEFGSLCGLGQMAPRPILSALEHFGDEFGSGQ